MIGSFKHKGLKKLYEDDESRKLNQNQVAKIQRILSALSVSTTADDMRLPAYGLHQLTGNLEGHYAVTVSGNWRITFRFDDGGVPQDVDLQNYH
jgi:proteic killer suppression protein